MREDGERCGRMVRGGEDSERCGRMVRGAGG